MWPFNRKKEEKDEDPIISAHKQETARAFSEDMEAVRDRLKRDYPSAESAIEDYRRGYITEEQLRLRFTDEEIALIYKEKKERDDEDDEAPSNVL